MTTRKKRTDAGKMRVHYDTSLPGFCKAQFVKWVRGNEEFDRDENDIFPPQVNWKFRTITSSDRPP